MGNELLLALISTSVFLILALFVVSFALLFKRRQLQNVREKEFMRTEFESELLQAQIEVQEQTLQHISQELHDNIGQILSLVKINLNNVDIRQEEAALLKLGNTKTLVSKALSDLRSLAKTLDANYVLRSKLSEALRFELDYIEQANGCATTLSVQGEERLLTSQQQVVVFRIAQEVLNNAVKHAHPTRIGVGLVFEPTCFQLRIEDDGVGFDLGEMQRAGAYENGAGLNNMYTRSAMIGARFNLQSAPGQGTKALLEI